MFMEEGQFNLSYGCRRNTTRISSTSHVEHPDSYTMISELAVSKADSLIQKGEME